MAPAACTSGQCTFFFFFFFFFSATIHWGWVLAGLASERAAGFVFFWRQRQRQQQQHTGTGTGSTAALQQHLARGPPGQGRSQIGLPSMPCSAGLAALATCNNTRGRPGLRPSCPAGPAHWTSVPVPNFRLPLLIQPPLHSSTLALWHLAPGTSGTPYPFPFFHLHHASVDSPGTCPVSFHSPSVPVPVPSLSSLPSTLQTSIATPTIHRPAIAKLPSQTAHDSRGAVVIAIRASCTRLAKTFSFSFPNFSAHARGDRIDCRSSSGYGVDVKKIKKLTSPSRSRPVASNKRPTAPSHPPSTFHP